MEKLTSLGGKSIYIRVERSQQQNNENENEKPEGNDDQPIVPYYEWVELVSVDNDKLKLVRSSVEPHPNNSRGSASAVLGSKIYVMGGLKTDTMDYSDEMMVFDTENPAGGWISCTPMLRPRCGHYVAVVHDKIYVFGGVASVPPWCEVYDPSTSRWHSLNCARLLPSIVSGHMVRGSEILVYSSLDHFMRRYDITHDYWYPYSASFFEFNVTASLSGIFYGWCRDEFFAYHLDDTRPGVPVHVEAIEKFIKGVRPQVLLPINSDNLIVGWSTRNEPDCVVYLCLFRMIKKKSGDDGRFGVEAVLLDQSIIDIEGVSSVHKAFLMTLPAETPKSIDIRSVKDKFVKMYYHCLCEDLCKIIKFYKNSSVVVRPEFGGQMSSVTMLGDIDMKIRSLDYKNSTIEINHSDARVSHSGWIFISVVGCLSRKDNEKWNFLQYFLLEPSEGEFQISRDVLDWVNGIPSSASLPRATGKYPSAFIWNLPSDMKKYQLEAALKKFGGIKPGGVHLSKAKACCYASIVFEDLRALRYAIQFMGSPFPVGHHLVDPVKDICKCGGQILCIRNLPFNMRKFPLELAFKKFGAIKSGGIWLSRRKEACEARVEFHCMKALHNAIEGFPLVIGGHSALIGENWKS